MTVCPVETGPCDAGVFVSFGAGLRDDRDVAADVRGEALAELVAVEDVELAELLVPERAGQRGVDGDLNGDRRLPAVDVAEEFQVSVWPSSRVAGDAWLRTGRRRRRR